MRLWPLFLLALPACVTSTRVVRLSPTPHEPRPENTAIELYSAHLPRCPFEEIGIVSAHRETWLVPGDAVADALRNRARELGGDAVVRVGFLSAGELTGTVVRFKQDDCRE